MKRFHQLMNPFDAVSKMEKINAPTFTPSNPQSLEEHSSPSIHSSTPAHALAVADCL